MHYSDHDAALLVWGVATLDHQGRLSVQAHRSKEFADAAAERAPRVTLHVHDPRTGTPRTLSDVFALVYFHATEGWTFAAVGWPTTAHTPPDQQQPTSTPAHPKDGHRRGHADR